MEITKPTLNIAWVGMDETYFYNDETPWLYECPQDSWIVNRLRERFDVKLVQTIMDSDDYDESIHVDLLFASTEVLSMEELNRWRGKDTIVICLNNENCWHDLGVFDYSVSCCYPLSSKRTFYLPYFITNMLHSYGSLNLTEIQQRYEEEAILYKMTSIIRNEGSPFRGELLSSLWSRFGEISFGGEYRNNVPKIGTEKADKIKFIKQGRINLALENASVEGYVTEKIIDSLVAKRTPIYAGYLQGGYELLLGRNYEVVDNCVGIPWGIEKLLSCSESEYRARNEEIVYMLSETFVRFFRPERKYEDFIEFLFSAIASGKQVSDKNYKHILWHGSL